MTVPLILCSLVLLICIFFSKALYKFGVPSLLIFLVIGMLFGSDGIVGIKFENYELVQQIGSIGLIFIMFYGGFSTNWKAAKPVATKSVLMSTLGVIITSLLTGVFCKFILKTSTLEGLLIGAVVGSTDAASVFSILRSRKLNLKNGLASLLEVESGSNDPMSYMLTITILSFMSNEAKKQSIFILICSQIIFGVLVGIVLAKIVSAILKKVNFEVEGMYPIFVMAIAVLSYSLSEWIGGNGYLSVYICGIIIGNSKIKHKRSLVSFFDGISWLMQIMLFFILGLLSFPSKMPDIIFPAVLISLFLIFIARPIATFGILTWFKVPLKEQIFISWVGLRGAASIVFAIFAVTHKAIIETDIFHIVFFIALFSVSIQGTLIPALAKKLDLVDDDMPVLKTFNDYKDDFNERLVEVRVTKENKCVNKAIVDLEIPDDILIVLIKRKNMIVHPRGSTVIEDGDVLVVGCNNLDKNYMECFD